MGTSSLMLGPISSFMKNGLVTNDYDPTKTSTYKVVNPVFEEFMREVQTKEDEIAAKLREDNKVTKTSTEEYINDKGEKKVRTVTEIIYPDVMTQLNYINHGYIFAYINMKDEKVLFGNKFKSSKARKKMIKDFYTNINSIKTKKTGTMSYIVYNEFLGIDDVAELYFGEDEADKAMFMTSYELYCQFFGYSIDEGSSTGEKEEGLGEGNTGESVIGGMDIPLYLQYSAPWGSMSYGEGTISTSGCAPTALAMVVSYMTKNAVLPSDIVDYVGNQYYVSGQGSSWDIFSAVAIHYQFSCSNLGMSKENITNELKKGHPVIASMGPGQFTKGGHIIVLRGITEDGKILVNDPNDNATKNHKSIAFDLDFIIGQAKNFWSFY